MPALRRKIRVLVVDDSLVFRETLARGIALDPAIEVIATATDPYDARDKIIAFEPDVMTLDVEMPRMNGIDFLRRLMPQYPLPVVVISSIGSHVFDALKAGAVDFVTKPDLHDMGGLKTLINDLIGKIKIASVANMKNWQQAASCQAVDCKNGPDVSDRFVAVGSSTGGTEAVYHILSMLPPDAPGILVVQHMPPRFTAMYADRLNKCCPMEVREAQNGDRIHSGLVLIAPGDYHMRIKKTGTLYSVECFQGPRVNGHCPSVDVLFESMAEVVKQRAVGIVLTGMGSDGARGLLQMRRQGARTIGQDEQSSVVYGMPKVAWEMGAVEKQAALRDIPRVMYALLGQCKS
ncbi:Chemotaxis response regulator protein-glutamate methylesterase 2 [Propionispora sp. 2/2-37]|uniref:protein-glutamate methylesterase/protein-glutamine glutaminase n=1 Tax=Propionispora sp. 2/2-37 TaxID=1677858 RepID=UPI0006BB9909|nr:chemotaxis response regulator protein-glutamate methylesterase [Propionispora sp. 2/2-37]CUH95713.1 Chemotaxis response regulator protein-glutamate methylesterase 2 [Propionispora sp. 2/2-37]